MGLHARSHIVELQWSWETVRNQPRTTKEDLVNDLKAAGTIVIKKTIGNTLCREGLKSCSTHTVPLLKKAPVLWSFPMIQRRTGWSVVVRWDQNPALWHQLNSPCLEEEECCLWPQEHRQTWRWKHYALGVFSAKGKGQLHRIKGAMDGVMYRQGQGIENGSWMDIPAWQWSKTHGQGNKGVAQEEAH